MAEAGPQIRSLIYICPLACCPVRDSRGKDHRQHSPGYLPPSVHVCCNRSPIIQGRVSSPLLFMSKCTYGYPYYYIGSPFTVLTPVCAGTSTPAWSLHGWDFRTGTSTSGLGPAPAAESRSCRLEVGSPSLLTRMPSAVSVPCHAVCWAFYFWAAPPTCPHL